MKRGCARGIYDLMRGWGDKLVLSDVERAHLTQTMKETGDSDVSIPLFAVLYPKLKEEDRVFLLRQIAGDPYLLDRQGILFPLLARDNDLVEKAIVQRLRQAPEGREAERLFFAMHFASQAMRKKVYEEFKAKQEYVKYVQDLQSTLQRKDP